MSIATRTDFFSFFSTIKAFFSKKNNVSNIYYKNRLGNKYLHNETVECFILFYIVDKLQQIEKKLVITIEKSVYNIYV